MNYKNLFLILLIFGGFAIFLEYMLAGLALCITIVGIPFGLQSFKLGVLALWPFGKKIPLSEIKTENGCIINTINPHSYCVAKKDKIFSEALLSSDVLLPDGSGIVLATKILTGKKINKIAGADIHYYLLEQAHLKNQKVFYLDLGNRFVFHLKRK